MRRPAAHWFAVAPLLPAAARAHAPAAADLSPTALADALRWQAEPWVVALLAASLALYAAGTWRLWRQAGVGHGVTRRQAAAFVAGWATLVLALASPLDSLSAWLFSAHMVQHELLMIAAAPLLVAGRPLAAWVWAFPPAARRRIGRALHRPAVERPWQFATDPLAAWALHGAILWGWHLPQLFGAALSRPALHALQHGSFLLSALLFWWAPLAGPRQGRGWAMFSVFTTMVHTGALGALLTLAPTPWYGPYLQRSAAIGIDPLVDQQLGGLVMWIPAAGAYLLAGLLLVARALSRRREHDDTGVAAGARLDPPRC